MPDSLMREGAYLAGLFGLSLLISLGIKLLGLGLSGEGNGAIALVLVLAPALLFGIVLLWRGRQGSASS